MYVNAGLYLYKNQPPRGNFFWTLPFYDSDEETRSEGKEWFIRKKDLIFLKIRIQVFSVANRDINRY